MVEYWMMSLAVLGPSSGRREEVNPLLLPPLLMLWDRRPEEVGAVGASLDLDLPPLLVVVAPDQVVYSHSHHLHSNYRLAEPLSDEFVLPISPLAPAVPAVHTVPHVLDHN